MSAVVRLSHSAAGTYLTCPRKYKLSKIDRLRESLTPWYFAFGRAFDEACLRGYLAKIALGQTPDDPADTFERIFTAEAASVDVYNSGWNFQSALWCGRTLAERFPQAWNDTGLIPMLDPKGVPIIARRLAVDLNHNLLFEGEIDVLAMTEAGRVLVVDAKSCGVPSMPGFARLSAQPLDYHILVRANSEELGVDDVDGYAFFEGLKRQPPKPLKPTKNPAKPRKAPAKQAKGPEFVPMQPEWARSDQAIAERIEQLHWIADDIRRKRFAMRSGAAFDSPCRMCAFSKFCASEGADMTGLEKAASRSSPTLAVAA